MKNLAAFVWYVIAAVMYFGLWAIIALISYGLILFIVRRVKLEWLKYL